MMLTDAETIQHKVEEYSAFVNQVLRPDLNFLERAEQETQQEIQEYHQLRQQLQNEKVAMRDDADALTNSRTMMVDLGHRKVYCQAKIDDASMVYVHVGMGFHVELTIPEAMAFCDQRIAYLQRDVLTQKQAKRKKVQDHLQSAEAILDQLCLEMKRMRSTS